MEQDTPPRLMAGSRLCLTIRKEGVTAYGNPAALRTLARWLDWIASKDPAEHFECHVRMDIEDEASKFEGKMPANVWTLFDEQLYALFDQKTPFLEGSLRGFELTFMAVPERELDEMARFQESGLLPPVK